MQAAASNRSAVTASHRSLTGSTAQPAAVLLHPRRSTTSSRTSITMHSAQVTPTASSRGADFSTVVPDDQVHQLLQLPFPPVPPLIGNEKGSFAEETITTRLPVIMSTVLEDMKLQAEECGAGSAAAAELDVAAAAVREIQADMPADAPLVPLVTPAHLPADHPLRNIITTTNAAVAAWQQHITQQQQQQQSGGSSSCIAAATWLQLPWLVVECYLYVRLATIVAAQPTLLSMRYDPFFRQKAAALDKSLPAAADIAAAAAALLQQQQSSVAAAGCGGDQQMAAHFSDEAKQRIYALMQYCLWGNKVDLSLLTDVTHLDIINTGSTASSSSSSNIIVDDFDQLWECLKSAAALASKQRTGSSGLAAAVPRIDIILDNAGLELYTDLILAEYVITTGLAAEVVLHGKQLPWFVSDTLDRDLQHLIDVCSRSSSNHVAAAAGRWQQHLSSGRWRFTADEFWTTPHPFWWMKQISPDLYHDLSLSSLLIFKGDLNYRKLAGDCRWPHVTSFDDALTGFCPAPLVTLRTLKADVIAGLASGESEQLDRLDPRWQVNGKFGVVQFTANVKH